MNAKWHITCIMYNRGGMGVIGNSLVWGSQTRKYDIKRQFAIPLFYN